MNAIDVPVPGPRVDVTALFICCMVSCVTCYIFEASIHAAAGVGVGQGVILTCLLSASLCAMFYLLFIEVMQVSGAIRGVVYGVLSALLLKALFIIVVLKISES